jgi:hypothetical protein
MLNQEQEKPSYLMVTKNVIKLGDHVYQLRNITRVGIKVVQPKYSINFPESLFKDNGGSNDKTSSNAWGWLFLIGLLFALWPLFLAIAVVWLILFVLERSNKPKEYALILETSASSKALLISQNELFLRGIVEKINEFMDDLVSSSSYTFDLRQDNSIRVGGDMNGNAVTGDNNRIN